MARLWLGASLLVLLFSGLLAWDRALERRNIAVGKKVKAWQCGGCDAIYSDQHAQCPICCNALASLEFESMGMLQMYILQFETMAYQKSIELRMPGMHITALDAANFSSFEHRNDCRLYARACSDETMYAVSPVLSSEQACIDVNRLKFARYLVATGRLNEEVE